MIFKKQLLGLIFKWNKEQSSQRQKNIMQDFFSWTLQQVCKMVWMQTLTLEVFRIEISEAGEVNKRETD